MFSYLIYYVVSICTVDIVKFGVEMEIPGVAAASDRPYKT